MTKQNYWATEGVSLLSCSTRVPRVVSGVSPETGLRAGLIPACGHFHAQHDAARRRIGPAGRGCYTINFDRLGE